MSDSYPTAPKTVKTYERDISLTPASMLRRMEKHAAFERQLQPWLHQRLAKPRRHCRVLDRKTRRPLRQ
jgi:hypothetical protein